MKTKMNVAQAVFLASKCEKLFKLAAKAWERGNNSGDSKTLAQCETICEGLRNSAEALLKPLGIEVDYPGLYPSFKVKGFTEYTLLAAISAALDNGQKARAA